MFFVVASLVTGATVASLRHHRFRWFDRAARRTLDRRSGPSPIGAGGCIGRRSVSDLGGLCRPVAAGPRRNTDWCGDVSDRGAIILNAIA